MSQFDIGQPRSGFILGWSKAELSCYATFAILMILHSTLYNTIYWAMSTVTDSTFHRANAAFTCTKNKLQSAAEYTSKWCNEYFMTLNANKSITITFSLQQSITIDPIQINHVLGVIIDKHLHFSEHWDTAIEKSSTVLHALISLRKSRVDLTRLLIYYRSAIQSMLTYAAPGWCSYLSQSGMETLVAGKDYA